MPPNYSALRRDPLASGGGFHLRYDGAEGVTLSGEPQQLLAGNLVRNSGSPALTGPYRFLRKSPAQAYTPRNRQKPSTRQRTAAELTV